MYTLPVWPVTGMKVILQPANNPKIKIKLIIRTLFLNNVDYIIIFTSLILYYKEIVLLFFSILLVILQKVKKYLRQILSRIVYRVENKVS